MFDFRWISIGLIMFNLLTFTWLPSVIFLGLLLLYIVYPKLLGDNPPRVSWCFQVAITLVILIPYLAALMPHGGESEQEWLDGVIAHLEQRSATCEDIRMKKMIDYTIRRYNTIGSFCVRVAQLPEDTLGLNSPFCPGITVAEELIYQDAHVGAYTLVHEAMHDHPPFFCHFHIDNNHILRAVK